MPRKNNDINPTHEEFVRLREGMVAYLQQTQALRSSLLTKAFLEIPREHFLLESYHMHAYEDMSIPTLGGESTSQPRVLAQMLELLEVQEGMKVLEVGSGSGYTLALLAKLVGAKGKALGVESNPHLVEFSNQKLKELKLKQAKVVEGDGVLGLVEKEAPFDRILVSGAVPFIPPALFKQLKEKGHIIAPVGDGFSQQLIRMAKFKGKIIKREIEGNLYEFSPLRSKALLPKKME